jgi:hypothetical protein
MVQEIGFQASHPLAVYRATTVFSHCSEIAERRPTGLPTACPKSSQDSESVL